ncbi:TonB-dependent siderophore receptor [Massilia cavernae]|uniref:TonB-dependent receptor n=1 Tax=Massilia cavernae TaxID=2320864 RepID=A0A418XFM9_9BURK|nr:TonB-dependent receptor [Massilia cavernae]RJG11273.1 TonB-dependent receptor [Massilia cavernae]
MLNRTVLASAIALAVAQMAHAQTATQNGAPAPEAAAAPPMQQVTVKGNFISSGSASAMKLAVPVRDTPFTVASYTDTFMKAIEVVNVADLYNYMTGIKRSGNTGMEMSIRGFKTGANDKNAIMVDGLPGLSGRFSSPPVIGTDHVEVVKGPASVLYGQAQPGGFVNLVSKKPQASFGGEFGAKVTGYHGDKLSLGDANGYDVSMDVTGPIDAEGSFLYRFVAQANDTDTFRDRAYNKGGYAAPSFTWKVSPATSATIGFEYRRSESAYDQYLVAPNKDITKIAPITTHYNEPGDVLKEDGHATTVSLSHAFGGDVKWSLAGRFVENSDDARGYDNTAIRPDGVTLQRRARKQENAREFNYIDSNVTLPFTTADVGHKMIVGVNAGRDTLDTNRIQFFNGPATGPQSLDINIYNPVFGRAAPLDSLPAVNPATPGNLNRRYTVTTSSGVYASDLMTLAAHWKLNLGLRYTAEKQRFKELKVPNVAPGEKSTSKVLPLAGLLYQPDKETTYYASYSTSYVPAPANSQDINGNNPFTPESARQFEVGAKANFMNNKLRTTFALFRIEKENVLSSFACPRGTCAQQIGSERAQGFELEVNAKPLPNLQIATGWAHTRAVIVKSADAAQVGARLTNAPLNSANLWSRYDIDSGALEGLGIGFGVVYSDERTGNIPSTADRRVLKLPSYVIADLGLYYSKGDYDFTAKVGNLFDKTYYESAGFMNELQILPGAPRNLAFSVRKRF